MTHFRADMIGGPVNGKRYLLEKPLPVFLVPIAERLSLRLEMVDEAPLSSKQLFKTARYRLVQPHSKDYPWLTYRYDGEE